MGKKSDEAVGCLIMLIIGSGLFMTFPQIGVIIVVAIVVLGILYAVLSGPGSCDVCGAQLKRAQYIWTIKGEKRIVCPKCNNRLESKRSKEAVDDLLGG